MDSLDRENRAATPRRFRSVRWVASLVLLAVWAPTPALAWGGKVRLKRRYYSGRTTVYSTRMRTRTELHSDPPALVKLLPPLPANFTLEQRNTVTVKAVHPDGSADIENHFDKFEFRSDIADGLPESLRDPAMQAQQEISSHLAGQSLVAHYDRNGLLLGFEGGEGLFEQLDLAHRETLRQVVGFFLQQMAGGAIFPDHPVKPGETWKHKLDAPPGGMYSYKVEGENTLRYTGKTKVRGVKAAIVEFSFVSTMTPSLDDLRKTGPLAQLESFGLGMDLRVEGQGKGRVLLALDDGRVLQDHASVRQTMSAGLRSSTPAMAENTRALKIRIQSDTDMDVDGSNR